MSSTIRIAKDFSDVPSGRYLEDGDFNGQKFREQWLVPLLEKDEVVDVIFDGAEGYGSSFLEEAFGGLVRMHGFTREFLSKHLHLVAKSITAQRYKRIAQSFIDEALLASTNKR